MHTQTAVDGRGVRALCGGSINWCSRGGSVGVGGRCVRAFGLLSDKQEPWADLSPSSGVWLQKFVL